MAHHIELSGCLRVPAPLAEALVLFTPEGERGWVPEWEPEYLHPLDGACVTGLVFRTRHGGELTLWLVSQCDPESGAIDYVRITPDSRIGTVSIRCASIDGGTETTISYRLTALSPAGETAL